MTRLIVPRQFCTSVSVRFDDGSLADEFEALVDQGYAPAQFARIWLHTHPGESPQPSGVDEETFAKKFSDPDWGIMGILARNGATYVRLRWNRPPQLEVELATEVDFHGPFGGSRIDDWKSQYRERVIPEATFSAWGTLGPDDPWWIGEGEWP